jgi:Uma2 family endonuclease
MGLPQPNLHLDPEAFLEWEKTQLEKYEYLDGQVVQVYAMVGARDAHVTTAGNIFALLREHLRGGPCRVYISDMKLRMEAVNAFFYPDVFVTRDPRDRAEDTYKRFPNNSKIASNVASNACNTASFIWDRTASRWTVFAVMKTGIGCFMRSPARTRWNSGA